MPCLTLANPKAFKIIKTNTLEIGYYGILLQKIGDKEEIVRFAPQKLGIKPNSIIGLSKKRF